MYVTKQVEDGKVKMVFVQSAENNINILTKNLSGILHEKHSKKMIGTMPKQFVELRMIWR